MTNPDAEEQVVTPEGLLRRDLLGFELLDGRLKAKGSGMEAGVVGARLLALLQTYVKAHSLGHVISAGCGYQIFAANPTRIRKPDGSFVARGKLPDEKLFRGHSKVPPDLAFEVVSPNDFAEEIEERVTDFLGAGVRLMWVVYPSTQTIQVFRPGGGAALLSAADQLSGEDVVPGFSCRVADVFSDL
jgi:Uma2 family endonuclease